MQKLIIHLGTLIERQHTSGNQQVIKHPPSAPVVK